MNSACPPVVVTNLMSLVAQLKKGRPRPPGRGSRRASDSRFINVASARDRSKPFPAKLEFPALGGATVTPAQEAGAIRATADQRSGWSPLGSTALTIGEETETPEP